jgi:hypothetical protein
MPEFGNEIDGVPYAIIESRDSRQDVDEVEFRDGSFLIHMVGDTKERSDPFGQDDFLRAVLIAKWFLENHFLPHQDDPT